MSHRSISAFTSLSIRVRATLCGSFAISHPHATNTRHPAAIRSRRLRRSRLTFALNFSPQAVALCKGIVALLQRACLCQKHPCTNITALYRGNTMSGEPGRSRRWRQYRRPRACNARLNVTSTLVFSRPTPRMRLEVASSVDHFLPHARRAWDFARPTRLLTEQSSNLPGLLATSSIPTSPRTQYCRRTRVNNCPHGGPA